MVIMDARTPLPSTRRGSEAMLKAMDHASNHIGYGSREGERFRRYYLRHVAISEGCGCAELSITRNVDETKRPVVPGLHRIMAAVRRLIGIARRT